MINPCSPSQPRLHPSRRPARSEVPRRGPRAPRWLACAASALTLVGLAAAPAVTPSVALASTARSAPADPQLTSAASARELTAPASARQLTAPADPQLTSAASARQLTAPADIDEPAAPVDADEPVPTATISRLVSPALVNINSVIGSGGVTAAGTGIVLTPDGEVLTNNHVINGASGIKAMDVGNGQTYQARVVGYDRSHDVAVLRLTGASGLRSARIGDSNRLRVGDQIAAVGNAGGAGGRPKVARGTVTDLNRTISPRDELTGTVERLTGLIEVAANVQPGDSGGPLVNTAGEVVGVDTAASSNYRYFSAGGTGYAIPINSAMAIARQIRGGSASEAVHLGPTAMLGVAVRSASSQLSRGGDGASSGVSVSGVQDGSPAQRAGLSSGDVIVGFDGTDVDSPNTLTALVARRRPGDRVALVWADRGGQRRTATVTLVEGPAA